MGLLAIFSGDEGRPVFRASIRARGAAKIVEVAAHDPGEAKSVIEARYAPARIDWIHEKPV